MNIIGEVKDRMYILIDDIIDLGGTLCNAAQALMDAGPGVAAYITHRRPVGRCSGRVSNSALELVITDSILPTEATANAAASAC
jgi:ribose-phosphate pyrophosphokinase